MAAKTGWSVREFIYLFGFLSICGFLVGITCLSSLVAKCKESTSFDTGRPGTNRDVIADTAYFSIYGTVNCGYAFEFQWWTLSLTLVVFCAVLAFEAFGLTRRARGMSMALLSISTVLLIIDINSWLGQIRNLGAGNNLRRSSRGALVGWIMMAAGNFAMIILLGYNLTPEIHAKGYARIADPDTAAPMDDEEMNPADAMKKKEAKDKGKDKK